jgi:hypothetical protein
MEKEMSTPVLKRRITEILVQLAGVEKVITSSGCVSERPIVRASKDHLLRTELARLRNELQEREAA